MAKLSAKSRRPTLQRRVSATTASRGRTNTALTMEMASDGFAMGKSVKRGKNSKKMDGKTYAMLGITEEEEMFLNTKAGQPMTAEKRAMQRRYWVAEDEWKTTPMFVLFPVAPGKQAWDLLIMLQVVYMCLVMPYRAVFEVAEGSWFVFETCIQSVSYTHLTLPTKA